MNIQFLLIVHLLGIHTNHQVLKKFHLHLKTVLGPRMNIYIYLFIYLFLFIYFWKPNCWFGSYTVEFTGCSLLYN